MRTYFILLAASSAVLASNLASVNGMQMKGTDQRFLRSFYDMSELDTKNDADAEERGIGLTKIDDVVDAAKLDDVVDAAKLDDLINPGRIKAALSDPKEEMALFAKWHENKAMSNAIVKKMQTNGNFLKNAKINLAYNNFRTRMKYNTKLTTALDTKALDEALNVLQKHGMKKLAEHFEVWFKAGRTKQDIVDALKPYPALAKKYKGVEVHYGNFVDLQGVLAKRAAAAAKKAAEST